jgi:predicted MFS family arabinose efflux permease
VTYERRARAIGVLETTWALGFLVGAPLAGWLIERSGWEAPFWLLAVAAALLIAPVAMTTAGHVTAAKVDLKPKLHSRARYFLAVAALLAASAEIVFITFATWLEDVHGFGVAALAALATGLGVAELAAEGATILVTDRLGKARAVALGLSTCAAGFLLMAMGSGTLAVGLAGLVVGVTGFEFAIVSSISLATELVPEARVRLLSRMVVAQALGRAAAALIGLAVYAAAGMGAVGPVAAAAALIAAWLVAFRVREHVSDDPIPTGGPT